MSLGAVIWMIIVLGGVWGGFILMLRRAARGERHASP